MTKGDIMIGSNVMNPIKIQEDSLPEPDFIVKKVIEQEKAEDKETASRLAGCGIQCKEDDTEWERLTKCYLKCEMFIRENPGHIPIREVAGSLHYGMTLNKMKTVIQQKFSDMVASGKMMKEATLIETKDRSSFHPEKGKRIDNLTRIWGAEYLKLNLQKNSKLDAPDHYLIVDNEATEIEVRVAHGRDGSIYPTLTTVRYAQILSQKIAGEKNALSFRSSSELEKLRFSDFGDPGNIISDSDGIGWVVDTEIKSFDAPKLGRSSLQFLEYLKKRFKVLSGNDYDSLCQTFKISLADIGIK
jgi:hypothetical protein